MQKCNVALYSSYNAIMLMAPTSASIEPVLPVPTVVSSSHLWPPLSHLIRGHRWARSDRGAPYRVMLCSCSQSVKLSWCWCLLLNKTYICVAHLSSFWIPGGPYMKFSFIKNVPRHLRLMRLLRIDLGTDWIFHLFKSDCQHSTYKIAGKDGEKWQKWESL
jgi:hypothetical protein